MTAEWTLPQENGSSGDPRKLAVAGNAVQPRAPGITCKSAECYLLLQVRKQGGAGNVTHSSTPGTCGPGCSDPLVWRA